MADELDCTVTGVDLTEYDTWREPPSGVRFVQADIAGDTDDVLRQLGRFDFIYSFSVWEHIEHPHAALVNARELLTPNGRMYLQAQLYRGPKASHRYRQVYFPWPHLLFDDEVFEAFYRSIGREPMRAAWVNKLTYAQYLMYFDLVGLHRHDVWTSEPVFDQDFYARFESVLGAYPKWDLAHDIIFATLGRSKNAMRTKSVAAARRIVRGVRRRVRTRASR
jgi:SAM-dependent methyltransferase